MKGIILAGGYGSRFFPITKTIPKEMLPLVNKPSIEFIIEEFIESGIKEILILTSRRKKSLEDYFDREVELETNIKNLKQKNKIISINQKKNIQIFFTRQYKMQGTGHALLISKNFINNSAFVLAFPDDLIFNEIPLSKQLINIYKETKKSTIASLNCIGEDLSRYGIINFSNENQLNKNIKKVEKIIEKPAQGFEPSNFVSIGRYLLTPEIFSILENNFKNHNNMEEFYLTDALNHLANSNKLLALNFKGKRYDLGEPLGYIKAFTDYALQQKKFKKSYATFIKKLLDEQNNYNF